MSKALHHTANATYLVPCGYSLEEAQDRRWAREEAYAILAQELGRRPNRQESQARYKELGIQGS